MSTVHLLQLWCQPLLRVAQLLSGSGSRDRLAGRALEVSTVRRLKAEGTGVPSPHLPSGGALTSALMPSIRRLHLERPVALLRSKRALCR